MKMMLLMMLRVRASSYISLSLLSINNHHCKAYFSDVKRFLASSQPFATMTLCPIEIK